MTQNLGLNGTRDPNLPNGAKVRIKEETEDIELYYANREGTIHNFISFDDQYIVKIEIQEGDDPYYFAYLGDVPEGQNYTLIAMYREEFEIVS